eukprot:1034901-Pleurochrysis_carterae.AAC.1
MGELCKRYGIQKTARIAQEYSNVKRLHSRRLQETENGALGIVWGRHKGELLGEQEGEQDSERANRVTGVIAKRRTAVCWGGEEYLVNWDNGEQRWINRLEVQTLKGIDANRICKEQSYVRESKTTFAEHMIDHGIDATQKTWDHTWREFLSYAQQGDRRETTKENVMIYGGEDRVQDREAHPTLYPGEVVGALETEREIRTRGRNMTHLTERARNNKHKQERKGETHTEKRTRLAKGGEGTRLVSVKPARKEGGGEWEEPARREDTTARKLLGGQDGRGKYA